MNLAMRVEPIITMTSYTFSEKFHRKLPDIYGLSERNIKLIVEGLQRSKNIYILFVCVEKPNIAINRRSQQVELNGTTTRRIL